MRRVFRPPSSHPFISSPPPRAYVRALQCALHVRCGAAAVLRLLLRPAIRPPPIRIPLWPSHLPVPLPPPRTDAFARIIPRIRLCITYAYVFRHFGLCLSLCPVPCRCHCRLCRCAAATPSRCCSVAVAAALRVWCNGLPARFRVRRVASRVIVRSGERPRPHRRTASPDPTRYVVHRSECRSVALSAERNDTNRNVRKTETETETE